MRFLAIALVSFFVASAARAETLSIVTGPKTGTYYAFGKSIADVAKQENLKLEVKTSEGAIDNIKRINSSEAANLGIVQSDVLGFLSRSKNPDSLKMAGNIRLIFPLYREEVHVLARSAIKNFSELAGKKIAIGEEGSGSMLTAVNLLALMEVKPAETQTIAAPEAVVKVLKGDLDAVIFVGGKPVKLFKNLEDLALPANEKYSSMLGQVHFLAMDDVKMLEEYSPAEISQADYHFVHGTIKTIAVDALLVSSDLSKPGAKKRCESVRKIMHGMREHLADVKKTGHPKWREVSLDSATPWKKDSCAWAEDKKKEETAPAKKKRRR